MESEYDTRPVPDEDVDAVTVLSMSKHDQFGIVVFSACDSDGERILRASSVSRTNSAGKNILMAIGLYDPTKEKHRVVRLPVSQFQIFYKSHHEISNSDRASLTRLYINVRQILMRTERFSGESQKRSLPIPTTNFLTS